MDLSPRALKGGGAFIAETHRTSVQTRISEAQQRLDAALKAALSHVPIGRDDKQRREVVSKIHSIHTRWTETKTAAIATGKLLMELKEQCREEYDTLFEHNLLPFGRAVECKLRKIAEAIRDERVDEAKLPIAYSAAYEIVSLKSEDLDEAKARDLIRPETQRQEVLDFKTARKRERDEANPRDPVKVLQARRAQLERRRVALLRELGEIDAELRKVNAALNPGADPEPEPDANFTRENAGQSGHADIISFATLRLSAQAAESATPDANFTREIAEEPGQVLDLEPGTDFTRETGGTDDGGAVPVGDPGTDFTREIGDAGDREPRQDVGPDTPSDPDAISRVKSAEPAH